MTESASSIPNFNIQLTDLKDSIQKRIGNFEDHEITRLEDEELTTLCNIFSEAAKKPASVKEDVKENLTSIRNKYNIKEQRDSIPRIFRPLLNLWGKIWGKTYIYVDAKTFEFLQSDITLKERKQEPFIRPKSTSLDRDPSPRIAETIDENEEIDPPEEENQKRTPPDDLSSKARDLKIYSKSLDSKKGEEGDLVRLGTYCLKANDFRQAFLFFMTGARRKDVDAQFYLGFCYEHGKGVELNKEEAIKYYELAAKQGSPLAATYLKALRPEGNSTLRTPSKAEELPKSEQENFEFLNRLNLASKRGDGEDLVKLGKYCLA